MGFSKDDLDLVLCPTGLVIMFAYQLYFLYRYHRFPKTTALGMENEEKKAWIGSILQVLADTHTLYFHLSAVDSSTLQRNPFSSNLYQ